ncbi:hypothetical protein PR048_008272 [Dryococelus australis]|uniref:Uncharacterized protein n=1 Tax=Dryococelus australis TaxID=614101 RepID=A0ABQ9HWM5_9NEOP|nr:hypothetical protein PR048_008272 [Dryococelus australis]
MEMCSSSFASLGTRYSATAASVSRSPKTRQATRFDFRTCLVRRLAHSSSRNHAYVCFKAVRVTRLSNEGELGSISGEVSPRLFHAGILTDVAIGWCVFSGYSRLQHPCIPSLLQQRVPFEGRRSSHGSRIGGIPYFNGIVYRLAHKSGTSELWSRRLVYLDTPEAIEGKEEVDSLSIRGHCLCPPRPLPPLVAFPDLYKNQTIATLIYPSTQFSRTRADIFGGPDPWTRLGDVSDRSGPSSVGLLLQTNARLHIACQITFKNLPRFFIRSCVGHIRRLLGINLRTQDYRARLTVRNDGSYVRGRSREIWSRFCLFSRPSAKTLPSNSLCLTTVSHQGEPGSIPGRVTTVNTVCDKAREFNAKTLPSNSLCLTTVSHQGEPGSIPGRVTPGFSQVEIVPLFGRFSRDLPFPPLFHSSVSPYSPHFTLVGSQDTDVKSCQISSLTHSPSWEESRRLPPLSFTTMSTTHRRSCMPSHAVVTVLAAIGQISLRQLCNVYMCSEPMEANDGEYGAAREMQGQGKWEIPEKIPPTSSIVRQDS